jgi:hypothetical protein
VLTVIPRLQLQTEWEVKVFRIRHLARGFQHFQTVEVGKRPNQVSDVTVRDLGLSFGKSGPKYTQAHVDPNASNPTRFVEKWGS